MKIVITFFVFLFVSVMIFSFDKIEALVKKTYFFVLDKYRYLIKTSIANVNLKEILRIEIVFVAAAVIFSLLLNQILIFLFFLPVFVVFPGIYVKQKQKKYVEQYYNSLVDFLESIVSNLKSGLSI
ncbi:MAG TPA: hypothetical protein PLF61_05005, partial [Candidatus Goldiibacteriota bacterium]|nr:hypothetical protein [Candidatus Goldiibacteriota bacterium]